MSQTKTSGASRTLSPVHLVAAAIDIGATMHVAAVGPNRDEQPVRTFRTFTDDLQRLADWFAGCGIRTIVMESTGIYWIPVFEILEQRGFEVMVVNARDAKHVPGRKTDVSDAQWLQRLHEYGLLRASFRPQAEIAGLRAFCGSGRAVGLRGGAYLAHAKGTDADDLATASCRNRHYRRDRPGDYSRDRGERDPNALAAHRDRRCHATVETVCQALVGNYREEHVFALAQALELTTSIRRRGGPATHRSRSSSSG
jgi:transposase